MNTKANMEQAHQDIEYIFSELLPKHGFLEREAQKKLSHNMLDAMICRRIALCDAGTGIGKTYAYLVAGIVYIRFRKAENRELKPIVVSTSSIALQNAVINEYLPFLSSVLLEAGMLDHPVRAALRKGKQHYVCDSRREQRLKQLVSAKGAHRRKRALLYLEREVDMDNVKGLPAYEKSNICVPTVCQCHLNTCQYKQYIAQRNSLLYLFQVCNHNLLIADAIHKADGKASILPESCAVIVDEYEIIGLNLKSQLNQGFRGLVLFLLTLKIADKAIHRRQYAQNRNLSAERGAASMCSASTRHTLPTYISFRRSTELSARVDLHRLPLRHSTHVPVARAA